MKTNYTHIKSTEILDNFISNVSEQDLLALLEEVKAINIPGPTCDEYMAIYQNELDVSNWCLVEQPEVTMSNITIEDILSYKIKDYHSNWKPLENKFNKKHSVTNTECFFFINIAI
jgi:hypothetical protein